MGISRPNGNLGRDQETVAQEDWSGCVAVGQDDQITSDARRSQRKERG